MAPSGAKKGLGVKATRAGAPGEAKSPVLHRYGSCPLRTRNAHEDLRELASSASRFFPAACVSKIKDNGETVWLICRMTGLYGLIDLVKSFNPAVAIKNC